MRLGMAGIHGSSFINPPILLSWAKKDANPFALSAAYDLNEQIWVSAH